MKQEKWNLLMGTFFKKKNEKGKKWHCTIWQRKERGISNGNNIIYNESKKLFLKVISKAISE